MTSYQTETKNGTLWGRQPVAIIAVVQAALALAVGFGLELTGEQVSLITALAAAILGLVLRANVYAPANVEDTPDVPGGSEDYLP